MKIEKRLKDILCYALGMINNNQDDGDNQIKALEFFQRIAKYLRSIGYYGDSPFMMCNYGSSEYAQAFSRVGSLFGNVYIVNDDIEVQDVKTVGGKVKSIEINYNDLPIELNTSGEKPGGLIVGHHFK